MRLLQDERVRRAAAMLPLRSEQVLSRDLSTETTVFTEFILTMINRVYIVSLSGGLKNHGLYGVHTHYCFD